MITVGKVLKAQGIKGEVKASCILDSSLMLDGVKTLFLNGTPHSVTKIRGDGNFFYVRFADVCDRNAAELLRNAEITCNKEALHLDIGKFFIDDVMGCDVFLDNGTFVGKVTDVLQCGAADVFVCSGEENVSFPFLKDLVLGVDIVAKKIELKASRFAEVVLDSSSEAITDEN